MSKTALVLLAPGFEELEALAPVDLLRRAGVHVTLAATQLLSDDLAETALEVTGRNDITVRADTFLDDVLEADFDLLVVPGGPGHAVLRKDERVLDLIRRQIKAGRPAGAICAAPTVLLSAGVLKDHAVTGHATVLSELREPVTDIAVVEDREIITSRGAGTATEFALALVRRLCGAQMAEEVAVSIHYMG